MTEEIYLVEYFWQFEVACIRLNPPQHIAEEALSFSSGNMVKLADAVVHGKSGVDDRGVRLKIPDRVVIKIGKYDKETDQNAPERNSLLFSSRTENPTRYLVKRSLKLAHGLLITYPAQNNGDNYLSCFYPVAGVANLL